MALSLYITPSSPRDIYAVYVAFGVNETILESPTEDKFDFLFMVPNRTLSTPTTEMSVDEQNELQHTIFMPPHLHRGNGTYIFGVKLISRIDRRAEHSEELMRISALDTSRGINLTEHNSNYTIHMYVSKCQYWDEKHFTWSSDGCQVSVSCGVRVRG